MASDVRGCCRHAWCIYPCPGKLRSSWSAACLRPSPLGCNSHRLVCETETVRCVQVVDVQNHPDAEKLYVEKIDLGEESGPRTVGLPTSNPDSTLKVKVPENPQPASTCLSSLLGCRCRPIEWSTCRTWLVPDSLQ